MSKKIHIIGGGIIGLTSAWYLAKQGHRVTVIERNDFTDSTSHGNAGMIVPSHFIPMSAPGVISQGIKWMFDSKSPFYVKPRMSLDLIQWTMQFKKSCTTQHVEKCMPILYEFNEWSKHLYRDFSQDPRFNFCFEEKGLLMLYKTDKQRKEEVELAEKANELGIKAEIVEDLRLKRLEPNVTLNVLGGVYFPGDAHLYPNKFINQLHKELQAKGVNFITGSEVTKFKSEKGIISKILLSDKSEINVESVIIAGGSWSPYLLKKLGIKILLQDGKGYSYTIKNPSSKPNIPTILTESKVAVTPMGDDLRIGGTLELGGLTTKVNKARLEGIIESIPKYYPFLKLNPPDIKTVWQGYRPCTPDGMPFIGKMPQVSNLVVATGHGMMGMSMGPATGKLVSEIIDGVDPHLSIDLFRVDRKYGL